MTMEIHEIKKHKSSLKRLVNLLFEAQLVLIILAILGLVNYLAFASGVVLAILGAIFVDVNLVLLILDILTSD